MQLIDAHHHLWEPKALPYGWLRQIGQAKPFGDPTPIQRDYLPENYQNDARKADDFELIGTVHVQADGALPDPVVETLWLEELNSEIPTGIVGFADLASPDLPKILERHMHSPKFRGIRQIIGKVFDRPEISFTSEDLLKKHAWQDGFPLLKEFGLSFDLQLYPEQMLTASDFFGSHPATQVVMDHAGCPYDQSDRGLQLWEFGVEQLSKLDNVYVKVSGFGMYNRNWDAMNTKRIFQKLYEVFGAKRMMWGSNFPVDRLMQNYGHCTAQLKTWLRKLTKEEQENIAWQTAAKFYRLDLGSADG
jgi:predicted TIM-barrel fold metal-dependent hydrolase